MTRVTNFGRKRKYLEAGFATETPNEDRAAEAKTTDSDQGYSVQPKKKRERSGESKTNDDGQSLDDIEANGKPSVKRKGRNVFSGNNAKIMKKGDGKKSIAIGGYQKRTEQRRLKRIAGQRAETVCFACREMGHAAKDCPRTAGESEKGKKNTNTTVGMCYRCGSTKHTLSRCKTLVDPLNPLPFASCFVCSAKGHLASACPQNKEKGIYPNGGSCKLCGEKTHLAKDCELRKKDMAGTAVTTIFGTGSGAGADEDDFHTFKRKNSELCKDEKKGEKRRKRLDVKAGLHTGTVKVFGKDQVASNPKKVVYF
ncbi:hypothetical protein JVU11DRAFT_2868 [Chiua virens]|nr:hypothetical protein JVU11DRAFT_2868 [Chiua virens]